MLELVFWISLLLLAYAFAGYPLVAWARARLAPHPWRRAPLVPDLTVVIAARNEERWIVGKLESVLAQDYPPDRLEVIVVSDGSTDKTVERVREYAVRGVTLIELVAPRGKAVALNEGVARARGELVVLTDARQLLGVRALRSLASGFADPEVGAVGARLEVSPGRASIGEGLGLYARLEARIRTWEAQHASTVGLAGALYAVRRDRYAPLDEGTILDDLVVPLQVARSGQRVVVHDDAVAYDQASPDPAQELDRRVRTLAGNYQLLARHPWTLSPTRNPLFLELISHKLLRLLSPFLVLGVIVPALLLAPRRPWFAAVLLFAIAASTLALLASRLSGRGVLGRMASLARAFALVNVAALLAPIRAGGDPARLWRRGEARDGR